MRYENGKVFWGGYFAAGLFFAAVLLSAAGMTPYEKRRTILANCILVRIEKEEKAMGKKDNFSQAMYEMFGLGKSDEEYPEEMEQPEYKPGESSNPLQQSVAFRHSPDAAFRGSMANPETAASSLMPDNTGFMPQRFRPDAFTYADRRSGYSEPDVQTAAFSALREPDSRFPQQTIPFGSEGVKKGTYFAEGTVIEGTLRSEADIEIAGEFKGEIAAEGKVTLRSNTVSSIAAGELALVECTLIGDAIVNGNVSISGNSYVSGNIRADNLLSSGNIKGNLNIQNTITLTESARVIGDIRAGTLAMSRGAKVSGKIDMID